MTDTACPGGADGAENLVAVLAGPGEAPRLEGRPCPEPGPGEVLVRVEACGLCGSDRLLQDGGFGLDVFPVVPGHEAAGRVVGFGPEQPDDSDLRIDDPVALHYLDSDPEGRWSRRGWPHLGPVTRMGVDVDGALARFVVRPARTLVRPRSHIPADRLAVLTDALATPHHALHSVGGVQPGEHVVVLGLGGIGSGAVQLAAAAGAEVIAVGRSRRSRTIAERIGADHVLEVTSSTAHEVEALSDGGADLVVVCTEAPQAASLAVACARPRGRVVQVAASAVPLGLRSVDLIWKEVSITGSRGYTTEDISAVQNLYLSGLLDLDHLLADQVPLADVAVAFQRLRDGGSTRILLLPWAP